MSTLLHLDASPRHDRSHSRRLSAFFVQQWLERHPGDTVLYRDLRVFTPAARGVYSRNGKNRTLSFVARP